ncbi:hypothetical protein RBH29_02025 [Herbivorax sp. ANBcel31]|uniref:coiled-coil domain-containing protein n=1 Tax=Herbivorax sp. ANBcel31 TaxID=3069754 RepID=UPI0027B14421|nr:hypothetical protein [Herbivorax sp. ANBcel31]MDQ2085213.1 hypothetical protein [Herbivorax sp. ANBcel31]
MNLNKSISENNVLDKLNEEELQLLIDSLPPASIISIVKKYPKHFREVTRGCTITTKSNLLFKKVRNTFYKDALEGNMFTIDLINDYANFQITTVKEAVEKAKDKKYFNKVLVNNNINDFGDLIEIILDFLKPEYIKVFFKLINHELTDEQEEYIKYDMRFKLEAKKLKGEIESDLSDSFKIQLSDVKRKHKNEINKILVKNKEFQKQLKAKEQEINKLKEKNNEEEKKYTEKIAKLQKEIEMLNSSILKSEEIKFNLKKDLDNRNQTVKELNKSLEKRYRDFSEEAYKLWKIENQMLLKSQEKLNNTCEELKNKENKIEDEIKILEKKKLELENKVYEYNLTISEFVNNIDERLIEKSLEDSMIKLISNKTTDSCVRTVLPYIKENIKAENIEKTKDINDFTECIAENLENIGVKCKVDEIANYIVAILASGMIPLICGYKSRDIASAISTAYSGEIPYIITLPSGYTNSNELIEIYNLAKTNAVLIEDAVGTMNENSLLPLLRGKTEHGADDKLLMISTENEDSIKYMPKNLLYYLAIVSIDKFGIVKKRDFIFANSRKIFYKFCQLNSFEKEYKTIKKLLCKSNFSSSYLVLRAIIIAYMNKFSDIKESFEIYVESELRVLCDAEEIYEQIEKNIINHSNILDKYLIHVLKGE